METLELVSRIWPIFLSVILGLAWLIRLEVNHGHLTKQNEALALENATLRKDFITQKEATQHKFDDVYGMFMGIKEQLARIEAMQAVQLGSSQKRD